MRTVTLLCTIGLALSGASAQAGPIFDDYLNYATVEQRCPADNEKGEGLGLAVEKKVITLDLTREQPIGQTIKLGPAAEKLWTIYTGLSREHGWEEGEEVTFTLWDSPAKKTRLYSRTLDWKQRWHKWDVPYNVYLQTKPGAEYYFEFTHNGGGDNRVSVVAVPRDDYRGGTAYAGGAPRTDIDLYFQILTKPRRPREENLKRFLAQFDLALPEFAFAKKSYDAGKLDDACTAVLRAFEAHVREASWIKYPKPDTRIDPTPMDYVCDEGRIYHHADKKDEWIEMSGQTTWREAWMGTPDYVRQNDLFAELGWVYYKTKNEKYAKKLTGLMLDYAQDNIPPFDGGMWGAKWNTMGVGWRLNDAWEGFARALDSKAFVDDVRLAWIDFNARMARQVQLGKSGGNQANSVADSMMQFGQRFPMFKDSKAWFEQGFSLLVENSLDLFREDGGCVEPAMNYHGFSLATLMSGVESAKGFGMQIPAELTAKLEKALAYTAYMLKPDGQIPTYGDTDIEEFRPNVKKWDGWRTGEAIKAYEMFGREDCLYIATAGRKGKRPESNSCAFPSTGHYVMRSDWGGPNGEGFEDSRYLFLRGGKFGSHGHWDLNQITLYAYGRPLLIDPGRTDYGEYALMAELTDASAHSVLLCEGQKMQKSSPVLNSWHTTPQMDFVSNSYVDLYPGVNHRRAIVFVRPGYYVMFDSATTKEQRRLGANFWLTPPAVTIDRQAGTVRSNDPDGSNVLLALASTKGIDIADRKGRVDHGGGIRTDVPVVTFWQNADSCVKWNTVIYPYPAGARAPAVKATQSKNADGCLIETDAGADEVFCAYAKGAAASGPRGSIEGSAGLIRYAKDGKVSSFSLVEGTRVSTGSQILARADKQVVELSVAYTADTVEVTCPTPEPTLKIASLGRKKAVVNGKALNVSGEMFGAF